MIARNLYRAEGKRAARRVATLPEALPDRKPGPEVEVGGRQELAAVLEALQMLPEVDRAALLMHALDDMPYAAIAEELGLSVAAVKVKVHRARIAQAVARARRGTDMNVTRDVITDLWPVYAAGRAKCRYACTGGGLPATGPGIRPTAPGAGH